MYCKLYRPFSWEKEETTPSRDTVCPLTKFSKSFLSSVYHIKLYVQCIYIYTCVCVCIF